MRDDRGDGKSEILATDEHGFYTDESGIEERDF
jgi:hypothetical protein